MSLSVLNVYAINDFFFYIYLLTCMRNREKIIIPYDKPNIILKGEGRKKTHVVWDDHDTVAQSPTFTSMADNIVVKSMSFTVRKIFF